MVDGNLSRIGDREVLKLFVINSTPTVTRRAKQVFAELERRGYPFDTERKDFVTCEQWKKRFSRSMPIDCKEAMARRDWASQE
jgi:hypothetical protein